MEEQLLCVHPQLEDVVDEREERGQGEGAHEDGDEAVLTVSDTGPGIPEAERIRVFDRFYRGADAAAPGSGLGLAIVQRIAHRHRASIRLEEAEPGRGLRVIVRWLAVGSEVA